MVPANKSVFRQIAKAYENLKKAAMFARFTTQRFQDAMMPEQARKARHKKRYERMMQRRGL